MSEDIQLKANTIIHSNRSGDLFIAEAAFEGGNLLQIGATITVCTDSSSVGYERISFSGETESFDSFRDMTRKIDESLEEHEIEPLVYTCFFKDKTDCVCIVINTDYKNVVINAEKELFQRIPLHIARQLLTGKSTDDVRIYKEYETVSEALDSTEMFTYHNVLDTI